ncbi:permease prefix domain 1-containing protein [Dactylosporangium sp. McL0621]|uniref:permease prefix domain 1-containing protein n=1 Tax=Dactylosporangium sp. McL0621 TaxID=3415678 RepID=UPI003CF3B667
MNHPPATDAEVRLTAYLAAIAAALRGPHRRRAGILEELRDGLELAVADRLATGADIGQAVTAAIEQFGSPATVAEAFAPELATAYARRTLGWFVGTGPLVGIWWLLLLQPVPWRTGLGRSIAAIPTVPLIVAAVAAALATFATTGRLMRWLPEAGPHVALAATIAVTVLASVGDTVMIGHWAMSGAAVQPVAVVALAASATRIACSIMTMRQVTALRHGAI